MVSVNGGIPSSSSILSAYATFAASAVLVRTVMNEIQSMANHLLPKQLQDIIFSKMGSLFGNLSSSSQIMSLTIDEYNDYILNEMFVACEVYSRANMSPSVQKLKVTKLPKEKNLSITMSNGETTVDMFQGIQVIWKSACSEYQKYDSDNGTFEIKEKRSFELVFSKQYKNKVLNSYLPFVLERWKALKEDTKVITLYALSRNSYGINSGINLQHPSTFATLAMDPGVKKALIDDLDRFVRRRDFYKRVGKVWKRGYLLYGPPGTGKSSLVAAMANYLNFNIYDLELSSIISNTSLRELLVSTQNKSILVIEDIDCTIELENREAGFNHTNGKLTLSGLLNFIDGLWSSCGDERIIVFTTNYKEKLDPALLRPGRMDMHIHMSYCTPSGFKILASNYLGLESHPKLFEIEKLITQVEATPAEIAEQLMKSDDDDPDVVLAAVIDFLERKKQKKNLESNNNATTKEVEVEEKEQGKMEMETKVGGRKRLRRSRRKRNQKCRI